MAVFSLDSLLTSIEPNQPLHFCAQLRIPPDLLAFDGHFPDEPILPGIVQLQIVRELIEQHLDQTLALHHIPRARMSQMVLPNDQIEVDVKLTEEPPNDSLDVAHWSAKVIIKKAEKVASRVRFVLKPTTSSAS